MSRNVMPALFCCHGGGPMPLMEPPAAGPKGIFADSKLSRHLRDLATMTSEKPLAILVISAHWEEADFAVTSSPTPPMLFDYYGFPKHTYEYKYSPPGDPKMAERVCELLQVAGHTCKLNDKRGYDHGVFVPLLLAYPDASIPVIALSLHASLDPGVHLSAGRALAPLRQEGVLILGSGISFHNMRAFDMMGGGANRPEAAGAAFDEALVAAVTATDTDARDTALLQWEQMPEARFCHPREEHLLPLLVAAGAAGEGTVGERIYGENYMGCAVSGFRFG